MKCCGLVCVASRTVVHEMAVVVVLVVLLTLLWLIVSVAVESASRSQVNRRRELLRKLHRADAALSREHARARQAMNDAAGQSWRNPFE